MIIRFGPVAKVLGQRRVHMRPATTSHSHPSFRVRRSAGKCL